MKIFIVEVLERGNLDDDLVGIALFEGEKSNTRRSLMMCTFVAGKQMTNKIFLINNEEDSDHRSFLRNGFDFNTPLIILIGFHYAESIKFPFVIIGRARFCYVRH